MNAHDIYLIAILIFGGIAAGYTGGLFGVGGGTVLVPVFLTIFPFFHAAHSVVMHMAIGTSLALLIPNTLMAAHKHYKMGNLDLDLCKKWLPFIIIGAIIGAAAVSYIPTIYLKVIFAIYLYASCVFVILKKEKVDQIDGVPHGISMIVAGIVIGGFSVLLGIGGGTLSVPYSQLHHYSMRKAIGVASAIGVFIGIVGTIGVIISGWGVSGRPPFSIGFVNVLAFIIAAPLVIFTAPYGVKAVTRLSKKHLRWIYAGFLLVVGIYMTSQIFY